MNSGNGRSSSYPDCWKCSHFFITFEKNHRYGCRAIGFKSRELPAIEVLQTRVKVCATMGEVVLYEDNKKVVVIEKTNIQTTFIKGIAEMEMKGT